MSALRISRPGEPVQLVDLGPAVGRIIHSRGPVYGSVAVAVGPPTVTNGNAGPRTTRPGLRPLSERCGHFMPKTRETCARQPGHSKDDHRSLRNLEDIRRRRWAEL